MQGWARKSSIYTKTFWVKNKLHKEEQKKTKKTKQQLTVEKEELVEIKLMRT